MLNDNGLRAYIIKQGEQKAPEWLRLKVPVYDGEYLKRNIRQDDILVVAEVMVGYKGLKKLNCRKILLLQAGSFLFEAMPPDEDHRALGFDHVMIIMPHMKSLVEKHVGLPSTLVPPFVAEGFFDDDPSAKRRKQILIYPKFHQVDYSVAGYLIRRHIRSKKTGFLRGLFSDGGWRLKELKEMTHAQVAEEMKNATFFISLNLFEALNTSVVEAMASGCIPFCYEAIGPADYLRDNENAIVFRNNEAYKLSEAVCDWIDHFEERKDEIERLRKNGRKTAEQYQRKITEQQLLSFFNNYQ